MKNGIVKSKAVTPTTVADKTIMIFQHPELYFFPQYKNIVFSPFGVREHGVSYWIYKAMHFAHIPGYSFFWGDWKNHLKTAKKIIIFDYGYQRGMETYIHTINPNCEVYLFYWNIITPKRINYKLFTDKEAIYSTDPADCEKYNFKYNDDLVAYTSDNVKTKINLKSSNEIEINVTSRGFISEINQNVDLENLKTLQDMENKLSTEVEDCLKKTLNSLQHKYKADVIGFGNKIYKKYPNEWKKVEDKWNEKYFPKLNIKVKANFKIESTGSLDRTIEEVNS